MVYYIQLPCGYNEVDGVEYQTLELGETSFKIFWTNQGFNALENAVKEDTDIVQLVKIKDEKGKDYSIEEFLDIVSKLNIVR
tara:strand:+ start:192 stop:437 length:246 start_codon:yes stop_codon:yes gene_type:complete